jgi:hypothetical protein
MGYFQNLEVELQEIDDPKLRDIIEWKRANQHMLTAQELWDIMTDEVKQDAAIARWRNSVTLPIRVKARDHVALQVVRRERRVVHSWHALAGWSLIGVAFIVAVTIMVVSL